MSCSQGLRSMMRCGLHKVSEAVPDVDDLAPTRTVSVLLRAALVALTIPLCVSLYNRINACDNKNSILTAAYVPVQRYDSRMVTSSMRSLIGIVGNRKLGKMIYEHCFRWLYCICNRSRIRRQTFAPADYDLDVAVLCHELYAA